MGEDDAFCQFDGDKSPAECGDESPHSKNSRNIRSLASVLLCMKIIA